MIDEKLIFTAEELENWVDSVGGIGTQVKIPKSAYWIAGNQIQIPSPTLENSLDEINSVVDYVGKQHIYFQSGWYLLWPEMKHIKSLPAIVPYPHICKNCKSPARKCADKVFCSNVKCKTRNMFKYFNKSKLTYGTKEDPVIVKCPKCSKVVKLVYALIKIGNEHCGGIYCDEHNVVKYNYEDGKYYMATHRPIKYVGAVRGYWAD